MIDINKLSVKEAIEILRRLDKANLNVKSEQCSWMFHDRCEHEIICVCKCHLKE